MIRKERDNRALIVVTVIFVIVLVGLGTGIINPQAFDISQQLGNGMQVAPDIQPPSTGEDFVGNLIVDISHRSALDNAVQFVEGTNLVTTYYSSLDEQRFNTIGSGSSIQINIDSSMSSILYASVSVPIGQSLYVAPLSTADQNLNPRIINFFFQDIDGSGRMVWVFKIDLTNFEAPVVGQAGRTLQLFINSFIVGIPSLNSPADITAVGQATNTNNFIQWEVTVPQGTASAQYEYRIKMNTDDNTKWSRSLSTLEVPNLGVMPLTEFDENISSGISTEYRWKLGDTATLNNANYVTSAKEGNNSHQTPFKFVTSLAPLDDIDVTFTINTLNSQQGVLSISDTVAVQES